MSSRPICGGRGWCCAGKTPALVEQEFYGLMMAHYAIRGLMQEAALSEHLDPDELSFLHAVRVVEEKTSQRLFDDQLCQEFMRAVL